MTESATSRGSNQTSDATKVMTVSSPLVPTAEQDLRIPVLSQAAFWRPRHLAASPILGQIPFLFWLMETIRPQTVVQFGIGDGVVYMGLCQASERLGDSTVCTGFDTNEPLMPPALREQHDAQYSDFSVLLPRDPLADLCRFDSEIDLLVLNQALEPEALAHFQRDWLPRLSDRSVVLVCHPEGVVPDEAVHQNLFPDKERLILLGPVSPGGHAVEAVLHGKDQPERLMIMAAQRPGKPAYLTARQVFNRLGQGIEATLEARGFQRERETLRASLQSAETALKAREAELSDQQAEVKAARAAEAVEISRQAEMSARLHDLEQALSWKSSENATLSAETGALKTRVEELEQLTRTLEAEHTAALETARTGEVAVVADLKAQIDVLGAEKDTLETQLADARAAHTRERDDLRHQIDALAAHRDALLTSTSWRITGPMRGIKSALTRR